MVDKKRCDLSKPRLNKDFLRVVCLLAILWFHSPGPASGQYPLSANHPELSWQVVETPHFKIYYDRELEEIARRAAEVAEAAFGPITSLYRHVPPEKVRIILRDTDDFANGVALYYQNTIEIWTTNLALEFELRGTSDWLRNVITHEYTHVVSLQVAQKAPARIPGFYFHYLGYQQEENRKDILQGFPDVITSYAVPSVVCPPWFAEGVAQYQASGAKFDRWDSHRDMILRMATLHDKLLSYDEMGVFEKNGLGNEKVYDHGYSLTRYIAREFGEDKIEKITRGMSLWWRFNFSSAIQRALGISGVELHDRWKADLKAKYGAVADSVNVSRIDGVGFRADGYLNIIPRWSPKGNRLIYLSNKGGDYGRLGLYLNVSSEGPDERLPGGAVTSATWRPDGKAIVFSKRSDPDRNGSRYWDLYEIAPDGKEARRLTHGLRATQPDISPDGEWIAFVKNARGNSDLWLSRSDGTDGKALSINRGGTQIYTPRWSPDGRRIAYSQSDGKRRDIGVVSPEGGRGEILIRSEGTDRDPCWSLDGRRLFFCSDVTGIFNIYAFDFEEGTITQVTNVLGGALFPDVNSQDGRIAFSHYGHNGYEIRILPDVRSWRPVDPGLFNLPIPPDPTKNPQGEIGADATDGSVTSNLIEESAQNLTASIPPVSSGEEIQTPSRPYRNEFSALTLLPRVAIDDGIPKVGSFFASDDILGKQSLFAGVLLGRNFDQDLFGIFELKQFRPTFYLEYYRQVRHDDEQVVNRDEDFRLYERIFALNEIGLGLRGKFKGGIASGAAIYSRYNTTIEQSSFNRIDLPRGRITVNYLSGLDLAFTYRHRSVPRRRDTDINPRGGREVIFRYDRFFNYFLKGFRDDASIVQEIYDRYIYGQVILDWREYLPVLGRSTVAFNLFGGIVDRKVDPFFALRIGGLPGMKGYTYYSLEGRRVAFLNAAYRFPLFPNIKRQVGPIFLDKIYGSLYADLGRAWDGDGMDRVLKRGVKKDLGAQIRFDAVSFHIFPTRFSMDAAYGLDTVPLQSAGDPELRSGLKFYFSLLFGYL